MSSNTGNTFDQTINNVFNLYTATANDTLFVNYGDLIQETIILNSS